jgi:hypothetical protein
LRLAAFFAFHPLFPSILRLILSGIFGFGHQPKQSSVHVPTINTPPGFNSRRLAALGGGSMSGSRNQSASVVGCKNSVTVIFRFNHGRFAYLSFDKLVSPHYKLMPVVVFDVDQRFYFFPASLDLVAADSNHIQIPTTHATICFFVGQKDFDQAVFVNPSFVFA